MSLFFAEYVALDSTLDELNSCLDTLESKNDDLVGRLQALLEDSRQARQQEQAASQGEAANKTEGNS